MYLLLSLIEPAPSAINEPLEEVSDAEDYVPVHTAPGCPCKPVFADEARLARLARSGRTLIVALDGSHDDYDDNYFAAQRGPRRTPKREPHLETIEIDVSSNAGLPVASRPSYIAICHVRAEGLGNSQTAALPLCQVARLQRFVDELVSMQHDGTEKIGNSCDESDVEGRRNSPGLRPPPQRRQRNHFWIDSLCVPEQRQQRYQHQPYRQHSLRTPTNGDHLGDAFDPRAATKLARRRMRHVFAGASRVLVLAPSVMAAPMASLSPSVATSGGGFRDGVGGMYHMKPLSRHLPHMTGPVPAGLAAIAASAWPRRLWTLQEGAVARRLFFRFADGTAELRHLLRDADIAVVADKDDDEGEDEDTDQSEQQYEDHERSSTDESDDASDNDTYHDGPPAVATAQLQPRCPPRPTARSLLLGRILRFSDDLKMPDMPNPFPLGSSGATMRRHNAKTTLRRQLRLCFLMLPEFLCFASDNERRLMPALRRRLEDVYGAEEDYDDERRAGHDGRAAQLGRLRRMLELERNMTPIWESYDEN